MQNSIVKVPLPHNEPMLGYAPGSPERAALKRSLANLSATVTEIPLVIGGQREKGTGFAEVTSPQRKRHVIGKLAQAAAGDTERAIAAAAKAAPAWAATPLHERLGIFLRAAELLATKHRQLLNAATMLGQSKTAHQAEIDAACESIDFWRYNVHFAERIAAEQPVSTPGVWNQVEARPLEGFVFAVTPFNFTAIGANLPTAPAMMGNTVVWKPAHTAALSAHFVMEILREAGLPDGVINFVPGPHREIGDVALGHRDLAGVHFTGSTGVFQHFWQTVGSHIARYRTYPRLVGETGGKDFILAHPSADMEALAVGIVRGGYEYQGQKCSAASRLYLPESLWQGGLRERLLELIAELKVGDVADFSNFMGAVIDDKSWRNIGGFVQAARESASMKILAGGKLDDDVGWFVQPTLVQSDDPKSKLMQEEIFGPVVTAYIYPDGKWRETLRLVDETSPYALTGAVWAQERAPIVEAMAALRHAAGNFYINDKPTGAVVGQQPFGGARASGTNDKAGSLWNLIRWVSPRTIKETLVPATEWRYPFLAEP
jgi:1-pyrroline-5-carboxylate dehydrogenase